MMTGALMALIPCPKPAGGRELIQFQSPPQGEGFIAGILSLQRTW